MAKKTYVTCMKCQNLVVSHKDEGICGLGVRQCQRRATYCVVDSTNGEVIEELCTQHAERIVARQAFGPDIIFVSEQWVKLTACDKEETV